MDCSNFVSGAGAGSGAGTGAGTGAGAGAGAGTQSQSQQTLHRDSALVLETMLRVYETRPGADRGDTMGIDGMMGGAGEDLCLQAVRT